MAASSSKSSRPYDLVVWGATGFTGQLVTDYISRNAPQNLRWAIAGRSRQKLDNVHGKIVEANPDCKDVGILLGDVSDPASLEAIVQSTRVILTTVGPFTKYGTPLVEACVRLKTDYVDSTGETNWIRRVIDTCHSRAEADGVVVVPTCGFDSVPSDIGTFMVAEYLRSKHSSAANEVKTTVASMKGGISGGTISSLMEIASLGARQLSEIGSAYYLNPHGQQSGPDASWSRPWWWNLPVGYDQDFKRWQGWWLMSGVNSTVVRRSNALLGYRYGKAFKYRETMSVANVFAAVAALLVPFSIFLLVIPPFRHLAKRLLPGPGDGPSPSTMKNGRFTLKLIGKGDKGKVYGTVKGVHDPGYMETAKMLSECAFALALERGKVEAWQKEGRGLVGGVLTPASAFGPVLLERLRNADMTFEVKDG